MLSLVSDAGGLRGGMLLFRGRFLRSSSRFRLLGRRMTTNRSSSSSNNNKNRLIEWDKLLKKYQKEIEALPESRASQLLADFLEHKCALRETSLVEPRNRQVQPPQPPPGGYKHVMNEREIRITLDAALATFCLHVESRIAALVGKGFYTIGPCGEEALSSVAHVLHDENDSVALHYRHLGINLARQLVLGGGDVDYDNTLKDLLLDRARGYTVSKKDPCTGGVHCSIGSRPSKHGLGGDFIVTSTLASQCPSAVGRALGYSLVLDGGKKTTATTGPSRPVSFVTVGDGSVHNHHFWSAFHLARHARHRHVKCPIVFGISDNGLSISYATGGYVNTLFDHDPLVPLFRASGNDMMDVYSQTYQAVEYSRKQSAPSVLLYKNITRRFGHAASDRQSAYLEEDQIKSMADIDILESAIVQAVEVFSVATYSQIRDRFAELQEWTRSAFASASTEDKVTREEMLERVSQPLVPVPPLPPEIMRDTPMSRPHQTGKREVMRKHMNRVIAEALEEDKSVVYIGEDVVHGGYYVITEGLASKFPGRIIDFPPDETSLLGAAMGFSQLGLTPIVEIPYSKYLDCGADMFYEICISNWLSAGTRPNGMIIRMQGFDKGLFGGNFHTNNLLQHIPPGVDVVCFSNGEDYVRGFRHAVVQARAGRVVMIVDCTHLLNLRHLHGKDRGWERFYPAKDECGMMGYDEVHRYGTSGHWAVVTYGNGVVTALQARRLLVERALVEGENEVDVIDCPYLSGLPDGLRNALAQAQYEGVLFADICKDGPGSNILSNMVTTLEREGLLTDIWELTAAPRTYNPLGSVWTFLSTEDIISALIKLWDKSKTSKASRHE